MGICITDCDGTKRYFNEDKQLHRDNDQPAEISSDGTKFWYKNGQLHRDNDQPAVIYPDGHKEWWVNDEFVAEGFSLTKF